MQTCICKPKNHFYKREIELFVHTPHLDVFTKHSKEVLGAAVSDSPKRFSNASGNWARKHITKKITLFGWCDFFALFFIGFFVIRTRKKTAIESSTIPDIRDFDYYRENLSGLSPAVISLLTDLEIEPEKDIPATILQFENLGYLEELPDHTYRTTEAYRNAGRLRDSDDFFLEQLVNGGFTQKSFDTWQKLVFQEAVEDGYFKP